MNKILSEKYKEKVKSFQSDKLLHRIVLAWEYVKDNPLYDFYTFEDFVDYLVNNEYDELEFLLDYYHKEMAKEIEEIKTERISTYNRITKPCKVHYSRINVMKKGV